MSTKDNKKMAENVNNELITESFNDGKFIVKYQQIYYDLTNFMKKHPGGVNTLKGLKDADMTERFLKAPPHSDAAMYLMKEYRIPNIENGKFIGSNHVKVPFQSKRHSVALGRSSIEMNQQEDNNNNQVDESMEYLVDWSKAMLPQIPKIAENYNEWVHKPVDRPLRLFQSWYLEMCTKTPWWVIPLIWIPVIITCVCYEVPTRKPIHLVFIFILGILLWTVIEYILHRWVFHLKLKTTSNPWLCTFHFLIHGLHHKVPFDSNRLVFPPIPGAIIALIIYAPFRLIVPYPTILLAGALFGYLCYDLMHYYLHYGNPKSGHIYYMKRYHYQHHFAHQNTGYGISTPLWDLVFNTQIHLRKLQYRLRWK